MLGDWIKLNLLSTPRDGMRVFPEGHPEETAPGPVCPGVIWMMQLQTEFVSIDLLIVLSVQDYSEAVDKKLIGYESTFSVQVTPTC